MTDYNDLDDIIQAAWCKATSSRFSEWSCSNPALGQDDVTSLVVQDLYGGKITKASVDVDGGEPHSHYFNVINHRVLDKTFCQYSGRIHVVDKKYFDVVSSPVVFSQLINDEREQLLVVPFVGFRYSIYKFIVKTMIDAKAGKNYYLSGT